MAWSVMCQRERLSILQEYNHTRWDVRLDMLISYVIIILCMHIFLKFIEKIHSMKNDK